MHLKTLTLRGFKSFASATTLHFEPGITAVVGPNGSGKSNVVDALAWVMGEQGAKTLRGGKMEDVIFAGTTGRAALGRAEVALTLDNSDGALPIDYAEVTITRTMFRNGGSEYAINGDSCRLLDIQELLSDSGIGREMHVIVGQGQLDSVLAASPEQRRGFIEEAAGVLKHRKRKEKALRKLEAMAANLARVSDLSAELRRQLKPLGKQAEVARRATVLQADLRDSKLRLLAEDLLELRTTLDAEVAGETALRARQAEFELTASAARARETELEAALAEVVPASEAAQETWYRLSALQERLRGTAGLAVERLRLLTSEVVGHHSGLDPDELERSLAEARSQQVALGEVVAAARECLAADVAERRSVEEALAAEESRVSSALRSAANRRETLARLSGQVSGLQARAAAAQSEIGRLTEALAEAVRRAEVAEAEFAMLETRAVGLADGEMGLDEAHATTAEALAQAQSLVTELQEQQRLAERERSALSARKETLELGLARRDGSAALMAGPGLDGLLGPLAKLITVEPGHEAAVAAALAGAGDALVVESIATAVAALHRLRSTDAGQAHLLVSAASPAGPGAAGPYALPAGARRLLQSVSAPVELGAALADLLGDFVLVTDLESAAELVCARPDLRAVTLNGNVLAPSWAVGGSTNAPSLLEIQMAVHEAAGRLAEADQVAGRLAQRLTLAESERDAVAQAAAVALARLNESDAGLAAVGEQLGQRGAVARSARAEVRRLEQAVRAAEAARDGDLTGLADLEARLTAAEAEPVGGEIDTAERDRLAARCAHARAADVESRLALRTAEERATASADRAEAIARSVVAERVSRERAAALREQRTRGAAVAAAVVTGTTTALELLEVSLAGAAHERVATENRRRECEAEIAVVRRSSRELLGELDRLTDSVHRDEVARAEHRLRIENLEQRAGEELGIAPDVLILEYGPDQPVPVTVADLSAVAAQDSTGVDQAVSTVPYLRVEQEKRMRAAEAALALLGRINPLALEEFAALEERSAFLTGQLEDLRASRRDLLTVVAEVDARVEQVFAGAYADTAREFEGVFARLFPGGEGRLILTDPDNMLTTGIEVEARPPGKKVKRLSLLSGGERSLVAVALLIAIFRARPSPFYVLDEVEAALDDTNLGRLIAIMEELRDSSQLIVITHQKRTMEVADALYGVSMRGDGATTVISQRLRQEQRT